MNVSYPVTGAQKTFEVVDDHKLRLFYEKRMGAEVEVDQLGDEWKGYILRVAGGNDKQGFPMKQGVLTNSEYQWLTAMRRLFCSFEGNCVVHSQFLDTYRYMKVNLFPVSEASKQNKGNPIPLNSYTTSCNVEDPQNTLS